MIDWSIFDKWPENTCTCKFCRTEFRSHSKMDMGVMKIVSRLPCPECGQQELSSSRSDPEKMTLS